VPALSRPTLTKMAVTSPWDGNVNAMPHRYASYLDRLLTLSESRTSMSADGTGSAAPSMNTGMLPYQHG